jgi:aspartyl protease family protein
MRILPALVPGAPPARRTGLALLAGLAVVAGSALAQPAAGQGAAAPAEAAAAGASRGVSPVTTHRVALAGSMGRQALLVIDGGAPRAVPIGGSVQGVRLLELRPDEALVEIDGQRHTLRLGASAVHLGGVPSAGNGREITLSSDARGHFTTPGLINGRSVSFLVDTGATLVALGRDEADRLGLAYQKGRRVGLRTANGDTIGWRIALDTVRVGDVEVYNVEAVVQPHPMPFVLLGNSFLARFQMRRENDTMTLLRRF